MLGDEVRAFMEKYINLWKASGDDHPPFERTYSKAEQKTIEAEVSRVLDGVLSRIEVYPREEAAQEEWVGELLAALRQSSAGLQKSAGVHLDTVLSEEFLRSTRCFIRDVNRFDPRMKAADIHQALRNVWVMNGLQIFTSSGLEYTPSIFAYSLLYPYTDNVNDSAGSTSSEKMDLNKKIRSWLEGEDPIPADDYEGKIRALLKKIEAQHPRSSCPGVYRSLLAIYNAQVKSLALHGRGIRLPLSTIVDIVFEKGGTSVLADGFLVRPDITAELQDYCFGLGTFLQLVDDLQDMRTDRAAGHATLFSREESRGGRDRLVNRLLQYLRNFLEINRKQETAAMERLIRRNCDFQILKAIAGNRRFFSRRYVRLMETFMPVRFSFLARKRKEIRKQILNIDNLRLSGKTLVSPLWFSIKTCGTINI